MLTIYVDFKSAASYLALEPTLALIEETGIEAKWLPFPSRPFKIPAEQSEETVGERHRRVRAMAQRDTHLRYGEAQGLTLEFSEEPEGSNAALAALAVLDGDPVPFMRAAFSAYWTGQANLNDEMVVSEILIKYGFQQPDWHGVNERFENIRSDAREKKVFETPTYLIDGQIFLGREHLPWIRSIISEHSS